MTYQIEIRSKARKALDSLPSDILKGVAAAIDGLAEDPHPIGVRKMEGHDRLYRVVVRRVYRVVYEVHERSRMIHVIRIGHRRDVYRGL